MVSVSTRLAEISKGIWHV